MDPAFWTDRWQKGDIGFHQPEVNDLLAKHWPSRGLAAGSTVFVPLCGKSLDMAWLANRGHHVVGVELSEVAVDAFFAEQGLAPATSLAGAMTVKSSGPFELWCGDLFDLPREAVAKADAAYDRASLVAFPPAEQQRYAKKLSQLVPAAAPIVLVGLAFDSSEMAGPPFSTPRTQIERLFGAAYVIRVIETRDGLERTLNLKRRGLTALEETLYELRRT